MTTATAKGKRPGIEIRGPATRLRSGKPELQRAGRERGTGKIPRHLEPAREAGRAGFETSVDPHRRR